MANEFIYIRHPDVEKIGGPVSRKAFERTWKAKGWREVDPDALPDDLDTMKVSELEKLAAERGVSPIPKKKADIIAALRAVVDASAAAAPGDEPDEEDTP